MKAEKAMPSLEPVAPKRRGRPAAKVKLEAVTTAAPTKTEKGLFAVQLSERNAKYVRFYKEKTGNSYNVIINTIVDGGRALDVLKDLPEREPAYVRKARIALDKWEANRKNAGKK